jgi:hypothetical protein
LIVVAPEANGDPLVNWTVAFVFVAVIITVSPVFICFDGGTTPQVLLWQKYLNLWVLGRAAVFFRPVPFARGAVFFLAADRVVFLLAADRVFFLAAFFFLTAIRILPLVAS